MKKLYTGEIKQLTIKNLNLNPNSLKDIAFESVSVNKEALFYLNFLGIPISIEHGTKLLNRDEAEYYLKHGLETMPDKTYDLSCIYSEPPYKISHEVSNEEFKVLMKNAKTNRKLRKRK